MIVKLLIKQCLELLSLKVGCTGLSEATLVKIPHCWKSRVTAHMYLLFVIFYVFLLLKKTFVNGRFIKKSSLYCLDCASKIYWLSISLNSYLSYLACNVDPYIEAADQARICFLCGFDVHVTGFG